ncbi:MAG: pyridoxamine 5'-phosphate oxidase family protein [Gammaproteobacteria bacterium]|nr:pyridoxamine 5'-phosphate oxidase family protein [Gammaproteobacteria bacterium]
MAMDHEDELLLAELLCGRRWGALATASADGPLASMVAFVAEPGCSGILLHLSRLAAHTRNLLAEPRASLVIGAPDGGAGDPQTLARVTLSGAVEVVEPDAADYATARARYLERLPGAGPRFGFGDFGLFRLRPREARYVGGFGRAWTLGPAGLARLCPADS